MANPPDFGSQPGSWEFRVTSSDYISGGIYNAEDQTGVSNFGFAQGESIQLTSSGRPVFRSRHRYLDDKDCRGVRLGQRRIAISDVERTDLQNIRLTDNGRAVRHASVRTPYHCLQQLHHSAGGVRATNLGRQLEIKPKNTWSEIGCSGSPVEYDDGSRQRGERCLSSYWWRFISKPAAQHRKNLQLDAFIILM